MFAQKFNESVLLKTQRNIGTMWMDLEGIILS